MRSVEPIPSRRLRRLAWLHALIQCARSRRRFRRGQRGMRTAEMAVRAHADVLGIVVHDLRNPLSVIEASLSLLLEEDGLAPAQRRRMLGTAERAVGRMNRLIGDLLDATRLRAGRLRVEIGDVDVRAVLHEIEETCRHEAVARGVRLEAQIPRCRCVVRADEGRLLQALGNLLGNAIKFTGEGGSVALGARPGRREVVFRVADTGPGIPPEHQVHLFEGFWQGINGDRRGVGLGLAITKGIVEALGGRIWVESTVGVGSVFSFVLPAAARHRSVAPASLPISDGKDLSKHGFGDRASCPPRRERLDQGEQ